MGIVAAAVALQSSFKPQKRFICELALIWSSNGGIMGGRQAGGVQPHKGGVPLWRWGLAAWLSQGPGLRLKLGLEGWGFTQDGAAWGLVMKGLDGWGESEACHPLLQSDPHLGDYFITGNYWQSLRGGAQEPEGLNPRVDWGSVVRDGALDGWGDLELWQYQSASQNKIPSLLARKELPACTNKNTFWRMHADGFLKASCTVWTPMAT